MTGSVGDGAAARVDAALLARRLLPRARAAFQVVPRGALAAMSAAIDRFIAAPAPSTFLAACRAVEQARRRLMLERAGSGVMRRAFEDGVTALRQVASVPEALVNALAVHLPVDARAGDRLRALAALAGAHQEISGRVVADIERRRRLWKALPRRPRPPVPGKRK